MISAKYRSITNSLTEKIGKAIARTGISPNALTLLTIVFAFITAYFIIIQWFLLGGILLIITAGVDAIDGAVARVTKRVTKFGSYLDAMVDRYVEAIIFAAIGIATNLWLLVFIAFAGSLIISYAKSRAAMETKVENAKWPDLCERGERLTILIIALILFGIWQGTIFGFNLMFYFLALLSILTHFTAIQRILRAKKLIQSAKGD